MLFHALLVIGQIHRKSPTVDEVNHLPAGLTYWQQNTFALYHHNPPLIKLLAAIPLLFSKDLVDYSGAWSDAEHSGNPLGKDRFGNEFMRRNEHRYFTLFFRARYVTALLSLLGMGILYLWTKELFGKTSALVAAFLWSCSPNIIAYAGVITTDLGITTFSLAATYVFWRWLAAPSYHRAAVSGVLLGLVQLVKFSALIFYPLWIVIAIGHYLQNHSTLPTGLLFARKITPSKSISQITPHRIKRNSYLCQFLTIILLSVLVINLGYGFEGFGQRLGDFPFLSSTLTRLRENGQSAYPNHPNPLLKRLYHARQNRFEDSWIGTLRLPLPRHYVLGFDEQSFETNPQLEKTLPDFSVGTGYPVYLREELRTTKHPETNRVGWWYYYLYALAVKVPVSTWVAMGFAALSFVYHRNTKWQFADIATLSGPPLLLLGTLSFLTDINIGLRYVLPVLPFLWIFVARLVATSSPLWTKPSILQRWSVILLFLAFSWNSCVTIITYPHYLSFFNYLAGGSQQGHKHLIDSNLDWGQDLFELQSWLKKHPQPSAIGLAYFGLVDPSILDIDFFLPPQNTTDHLHKQSIPPSLPSGLYAISINYRQGLPYKSYNEHGKLVPVPYNAYRYFQQFHPIDRIGNSIWLFQIDPDRNGGLERN